MKKLIKKLIPEQWFPVARKTYRSATKLKLPDFSEFDYGDRPVLKCRVAYNRYGGYCVPIVECAVPCHTVFENVEVTTITVGEIRQILGGQHRFDTFQLFGFGRVDLADFRVCVR